MLQRLFEKFRPWMEAMAELDDPRGEHLLMLERRIRQLECKVGLLQECDETGAGADVQEPRPNGFGGVNASITFRRLGERTKAALKNARMVTLPNSGHFSAVENPGAIAGLILS